MPTFRSWITLATFQHCGINPVRGTGDKSALCIPRAGPWEQAQLIPFPWHVGAVNPLQPFLPPAEPAASPQMSHHPWGRHSHSKPRAAVPHQDRDAEPCTGPAS